MRGSIVLSLLCLPTLLLAQQADHVVSPGMTRAQVVAALGAPATQRTASEFTYMFYPNACGRECGMNDLVILKNDSVTDAIFRSPNRHYTGTSSSPEQVTPEVAPRRPRPAAKPMTTRDTTTKPAAAKAEPAKAQPAKTATQLKPPAKANDTKPSIPVTTPKMPAAPATTPAKAPATAPAKAPATAPAKAPATAPAPDKKPG